MDIIRMLQGPILGLLSTFIFLGIMYFVFLKISKSIAETPEGHLKFKKAFKKIFTYIIILVFLIFFMFLIKFMVFNAIPKQEINKDTHKAGVENFEQRMLEDTVSNK